VGRMFISLKPPSQRKDANGKLVTGDMVVNRLRNKLTSVPGATLFLQVQQELQIGGRGSDAQYQYTLSDENLNELNTWAPQLLARMRGMPELRDASTDQQNQGLAANLVIDRDSASRLGITATAIDNVLYDAFGQREVSTMYTGLNQYFVVMEVDPQYQLSPAALNDIYVKASTVQGATTSMPATVTAAAATAAAPGAAPAVSALTSTSGAAAIFPTLAGNLAVTSTTTSTASSSSATAPSESTTGTAAQVDPVLGGTLTGMTSSALGATSSASLASAATPAAAAAATTATSGAMVPLSAIAHYQSQRTSLAVNHQGQYPAVTLTFNLAPNVSLGQAVTALENAQREMGMPSAIHASFQGTAQAFQDSMKSEPFLILAALVAVYIVLGILYESLIHPLTILSTLPPAGVGAILALLLTGTDLSIIALIGILLLIGIVKKNAIMMIDFALQAERDQGLPPVEAIYQACLLRFRPIMMTTMAAMFGGLPLAIGMGVGSELRQPLGITIVGGLIVSQALTLLTTPVVYLFFDKLQWKVMRLHKIGSELEGHGVQAD
jgi:multidrug efflux pump subunit AcrB